MVKLTHSNLIIMFGLSPVFLTLSIAIDMLSIFYFILILCSNIELYFMFKYRTGWSYHQECVLFDAKF